MAKKTFILKSNIADAFNETVSSARNNAGELHVEIIPLRKIEVDPENPRDFLLNISDLYDGIPSTDTLHKEKLEEKESLDSLAKSIKEQGVINPVLVYKHTDKYRLIAGERRTLASIIAGRSDIPARIMPNKPDALKLGLIQWIENIERSDLKLWERLVNLEKVLEAYSTKQKKQSAEIGAAELSALIGCSIQQGVNYRHLLNASIELRKQIKSNLIRSIEKAALISKSSVHIEDQLIAACKRGATLEELKKIASEQKKMPVKMGAFQKNDTTVKIGLKTNIFVVKRIIEMIVEKDEYKHFKDKIGEVNLQDQKAINDSFKQLFKLLEASEH